MASPGCPQHEELRLAILGQSDSGSSASLAQHLHGCSSCLEAVRRLGIEEASIQQFLSTQLQKAAVASLGQTQDWSAPVAPLRLDDSSQRPANDNTLPFDQSTSAPAAVEIPGYQVLSELGRGGMGVVYQALDVNLKRVVAVKMILSGTHASAHEKLRFKNEAAAIARLQHPNIVQIYTVGEHDSRPYFAMEYVGGGNLAGRLAGQCLAPTAAASLAEKLARAASEAHRHGIVHRDLKPGNVLMTGDGEPKINDFGLAKQVDSIEESNRTATGTVLGTPAYMAPEQAAGHISEIGPCSDIYSIGAILYCSLTGRPPFQSESMVDLLQMVIHSEPLSPRKFNRSLDRDLETICLKCLEKSPGARPLSALELADELAKYQRGEPIRWRPIGRSQRVYRWCKRNKLAAWSVALAGMLLVVAALAASLGRKASVSRQLAVLGTRFQERLDRIELDPASFSELNALAAQVEQLDPQLGSNARQRLVNQYSQLTNAALHQPRMAAEDFQRIESAIKLLEVHHAAETEALRKLLANRMTDWQPVFELSPPVAALPAEFPARLVKLENQQLVAVPDSTATSSDATRVLTKLRCANMARCEVVFEEPWEQCFELGVILGGTMNAGTLSGYEFTLLTTSSKSDDLSDTSDAPAGSFAAARAANGILEMVIRRNGATIHRQSIAAASFKNGPLRLRASCEREKLTFQIQDAPPLVFLDPFPLSTAQGTFGVVWPQHVGVTRFQTWQRNPTAAISGLEKADEQFELNHFEAAAELYASEGVRLAQSVFKQEAVYKQALCLMALKRGDEAAPLLESLLSEPGDRWPPLAGCRLWMMHLQQNRMEAANAVFNALSSRFGNEQLAALVPDELRYEIVRRYLAEFKSLPRLLRFNAQRRQNLEVAVAVDKLLKLEGPARDDNDVTILRAYELIGDVDSALEYARKLLPLRPDISFVHTSRILRITGRQAQALKEVNSYIPNVTQPQQLASMYYYRALAHSAVEDWDAVLADADRAISLSYQQSPDRNSILRASCYLIKGCVFKRYGEHAAALQAWREGSREIRNSVSQRGTLDRHTVYKSILFAFTGEATDDDADSLVNLSGGTLGDESLLGIVKMVVDARSIGRAVKTVWLTPRGYKAAEAIAFDAVSLPDRLKSTAVALLAEYFRQELFADGLDPDQEELIWTAASDLYDGFVVRGKISMKQAGQLALAWRGTLNSLGWAGIEPQLDAKLRGELTYLLAHRLLTSNDLKNAEAVLRNASNADSEKVLSSRLTKSDLKLISSKQGRLVVQSETPAPVRLEIRRRDAADAIPLEVNGKATLDLPAGSYELKLADADESLSIVPATVDVRAAGRHPITLHWRWKPVANANSLPGLIRLPAERYDRSRWQATTAAPRSFVRTIAWHPQQTQLAVGSDDRLVRVFDTTSGQLLSILAGHRHNIAAVAWSPDGSLLATASEDKSIVIWDSNGRPVNTLRGHIAGVRCLAWSPDGTRLASGGNDRTLRVWNRGGALEWMVSDLSGSLNSVAWKPDGQQILSCSYDSIVRLWDMAGKTVWETRPTETPFWNSFVTWSPDGQRFAYVGNDRKIRIWRANGELENELPDNNSEIRSLTWSPNGQWLASAGNDGAIRLFAADGQAGPAFNAKMGGISALSWSGDGQQLAASSNNRTIHLWNANGTQARVLRGHDVWRTVALNPATRQLAVAGPHESSIRLWNVDGTPGTILKGHTSVINSLAWSPDGKKLASTSNDQTLRIWSAEGQPLGEAKRHNSATRSVAWMQQRLAVTTANNLLFVWEADGINSAQHPIQTSSINAIAWNENRKVLALATGDHKLRLWSLNGNEPPKEQRSLDAAGVTALAWRPDGKALAAVSNTLLQFNAEDTAGPTIKAAGTTFSGVAYSPDGQRIAIGGADGTLRVFQADGAQTFVSPGHISAIHAVAWSADGKHIATCGHDATLRLWNAANGLEAWNAVALHDDQAVVFGPGGTVVFASEKAGERLVYFVEQPDLSMKISSDLPK